jgi:hypothetical protein
VARVADSALTPARAEVKTEPGDQLLDAEVTKQNPKPGNVLAPGSKVNVKLGG